MSSPVSKTVKLSFFLHNPNSFVGCYQNGEISQEHHKQQAFLKSIFQQNKHNLNITLRKTIDNSNFEVISGQFYVKTLICFSKNLIQLPFEIATKYNSLGDAEVNMEAKSTTEPYRCDFTYYYKLSENEKFVDFVNSTEVDILLIEN